MLRKTFLPLLVAVASLGVITGCSNKGNENEEISVTDMVGTTITIKKHGSAAI